MPNNSEQNRNQEVRKVLRELKEKPLKTIDKHEDLFERSPDAMCLINREGKFKEVNQAFCQRIGYERGKILGTSLKETPLLLEESRRKMLENFERRMEGEKISPYVVKLRRKDGEIIRAEINARTITENGEIGGVIYAVREVTDQREFEERVPPDTWRLLREMLKGKIERVQPSIDLQSEKIVSYPEAEELMEVSTGEVKENLRSLTQEGILEREFFEKVFVCPECGSGNLKFSTLCPNCGSPKIVEKNTLEHLDCGYIGTREEYEGEKNELICPKCGEELQAIGVDYSEPGEIYVCRECGNRFDEPERVLKCGECSETINTKKTDLIVAYFYKLNKGRKGWLRKQLMT